MENLPKERPNEFWHNNNSLVKQVIDELIEEELFEHMLIDRGYQSFTVFRNPVAP